MRYILDSLYSDKPDGLIGNEDVGQMSAWYVFSAMGFYPVNPANGAYVIGSPVVDEARIHVGDGKFFEIRVRNNSSKNIYVQKISLHGMPYAKTYLTYKDIMNGGTLDIEMGEKPNVQWGAEPADRATSEY